MDSTFFALYNRSGYFLWDTNKTQQHISVVVDDGMLIYRRSSTPSMTLSSSSGPQLPFPPTKLGVASERFANMLLVCSFLTLQYQHLRQYQFTLCVLIAIRFLQCACLHVTRIGYISRCCIYFFVRRIIIPAEQRYYIVMF